MKQIPLRTAAERLQFCDDYFSSVDARILMAKEDYREYQLPREIDKELTDRPYYWLWVDQTGQKPDPTILRLAFSPDALERENQRLHRETLERANSSSESHPSAPYFRPPVAELVSLGGFRLERIMDSVMARGRFICVRPKDGLRGRPVIPWLLMNAVVSYVCDLTEQNFISLGLCLTNDQIVNDFWQAIERIPMGVARWEEVVGPYDEDAVEAGLSRLRDYVGTKLRASPQTWAKEAELRLEEELAQLDLYYGSLVAEDGSDSDVLTVEHQQKRAELKQRAAPRIDIEVVQVALVGLVEVTAPSSRQ